MRTLLLFFAVISCIYNKPIVAEVPEIVQKSFTAMETMDRDNWSFTCTKKQGSEVLIERHDPDLEQKWQLISINGEAPSAERLDEYQNSKMQIKIKANETGESEEDDKFVSLANPDGWNLISETDEEITYNFQPKAESSKDKKIMKNLLGTMTIAKENPHIKSFSMEALKPFRPVLVAKILKMQIDVEFSEVAPGEYALTREAEDILVRALGKKQHQKSEKVCTDFVKI